MSRPLSYRHPKPSIQAVTNFRPPRIRLKKLSEIVSQTGNGKQSCRSVTWRTICVEDIALILSTKHCPNQMRADRAARSLICLGPPRITSLRGLLEPFRRISRPNCRLHCRR